jgi:hypothetical protein
VRWSEMDGRRGREGRGGEMDEGRGRDGRKKRERGLCTEVATYRYFETVSHSLKQLRDRIVWVHLDPRLARRRSHAHGERHRTTLPSLSTATITSRCSSPLTASSARHGWR